MSHAAQTTIDACDTPTREQEDTCLSRDETKIGNREYHSHSNSGPLTTGELTSRGSQLNIVCIHRMPPKRPDARVLLFGGINFVPSQFCRKAWTHMKLRNTTIALLAAVVLTSSMSMAAIHREQFETYLPGVNQMGHLDLSGELSGEGIVKGFYNSRSHQFRGTVRGQAANQSRRSARFRNDPELLSEVESIVYDETGLDVSLSRGVYRVSKRGRVSGAARGSVSSAQ